MAPSLPRTVLPALLLLVVLLVATAAQKASRTTTDVHDTPADYICTSDDLKTLCQIIKAAGNGEGAAALNDGTAIETVFAPTDGAFNSDSKAVASRLKLKDFNDIYTTPTEADRLLRYLIVPNQALLSSAFKSGTEYQNLMKKNLEYETAWLTSQVYIDGSRKAEIKIKDIRAGQAVVHVVDRVPYP
ncbi:hypothetical protein Vafri_866 [Volvox africanus]|nr:hypothetical protein Vafri_866 [Volvox africanus]